MNCATRYRVFLGLGVFILLLLLSVIYFTLFSVHGTVKEKEVTIFGNIYREIGSSDGGKNNQVWSPFGLKIVLAMLSVGVEHSAAKKIQNPLQWAGKLDGDALQEWKNQINTMSNLHTNTVNVTLATRAFTDVKLGAIQEMCVKQLWASFDVAIQEIKFEDVAGTAAIINEWAQEETQGRIQKILNADVKLRKLTSSGGSMILTNVVYFDAEWDAEFVFATPKGSAFFTDNSKQNQVVTRFLSAKALFHYRDINELRAEVVRVPCKGGRFSMIALLPHEWSTLGFLEKKIAQGFPLKSLPSQLKRKQMVLHFPKFEIKTTISFRDILETAGINSGLEKQSMDRNISWIECVSVPPVVQTTVFRFREGEGEFHPHAFFRTKTLLRFNRPFLAYVMDELADTIFLIFRKIN